MIDDDFDKWLEDTIRTNRERILNHRKKINLNAYYKWEQAGCPSGDGVNFWLEAEKEEDNVISRNSQ